MRTTGVGTLKTGREVNRYLARVLPSLALIGLLVGHVAGYLTVPYINPMEKLLYDTRLRATAPGGVDERIVVVAIDEPSLEAEGHWPWTRDKLARLVEELFDAGAAVVAFDAVFAERDMSADVRGLSELAAGPEDEAFRARLMALAPRLDRDRKFAEALAGRPTVLGYYFDHSEATAIETGQLPMASFEVSEDVAARMALPRAYGYGANLPELTLNALAGGFISNPLIDADGVVRRAPLLHLYGQSVYESLALSTATTYLNDIAFPVFVENSALLEDYPPVETLELSGSRLPIDAQGAVLVPFRGPAGSFPYVSAAEVINGTLENRSMLDGAIALVGATAPGLQDIRSTPFGSVYPGVEVHANVIAGILDQKFHWQPAYMLAVEVISILFFGLLCALVLPRLTPLRATLQAALTVLAILLLNVYLWRVQLQVLPMAATLLTIVGIYVINMFFGYLFETRAQQQISALFGQYVPPELVREMSRNPKDYSLASQRREMTVLFSDIRGFTSMSESLDAVQLSELLNRYLTPMTQLIHESRGTIDKYIGDAVMAFWGAPVADERHAAHAVRAGLSMLDALEPVNAAFSAQGLPEIRIGIGINTGEMSVGNMGSRFRRAYTVLGDAVNLASRIEGLTKRYGLAFLVGEETRNQVDDILFLEVDLVRVKGKVQPVRIFLPLVPVEEATKAQQAWVGGFQRMLEDYRQQNWAAAQVGLQGLDGDFPWARLLEIYRHRLDTFLTSPPGAEWDGVFTHEEK